MCACHVATASVHPSVLLLTTKALSKKKGARPNRSSGEDHAFSKLRTTLWHERMRPGGGSSGVVNVSATPSCTIDPRLPLPSGSCDPSLHCWACSPAVWSRSGPADLRGRGSGVAHQAMLRPHGKSNAPNLRVRVPVVQLANPPTAAGGHGGRRFLLRLRGVFAPSSKHPFAHHLRRC